jgi:hypothetical protein
MPENETDPRRAADDFERAVREADAATPGNPEIEQAQRMAAAVAPEVLPSPPPAAASLAVRAANPAAEIAVSATFELRQLSLNQIWGLAKMVAGMEMVPRGLRRGGRYDGEPSVPDIAFVLIKGAELDLSMTVALAEVSVIDGKLVLSSHLQHALVIKRARPRVFRVAESTMERAVVEVQRHEADPVTPVEFTWQEAQDLGLHQKGKDPGRNAWNTQRRNMLRRRAIARAAREFFGDVVIAYDPDEVDREDQPMQLSATAWVSPTPPGPVATYARAAASAIVEEVDRRRDTKPDNPLPPRDEMPGGDAGEPATAGLPPRLLEAYDAALNAFEGADSEPNLRLQAAKIAPLQNAAAKGDRVASAAVSELRQKYDLRLRQLRGQA